MAISIVTTSDLTRCAWWNLNCALSADKYDQSKRKFMLAMLCQLNVVNWACLPGYRKDASWTVHNKRDNGSGCMLFEVGLCLEKQEVPYLYDYCSKYKCTSKPIPSIHSLPAVSICTIAKGCWTVVVKETLLTVYLHRCQRRPWSQKTVPKPLVLQHLEKYANIRDRTRNVTTILSFYLHVPGNL